MSESKLPSGPSPLSSGPASPSAAPLPGAPGLLNGNGRRKAYSASEWSIHAWGLGAIASYFMYEQFYLIFNIHTTVFKVDPFWVGMILAFPRLIDGVLDPLLGHWSDNMRSRWGRRKPFLLFSGLFGAVLASSIFWLSPDWDQWVKCVFLSFSAISLFIACGTYDMAYTAMGYELSEEYADRSRIQAIKSFYWSLFSIIGGFVVGIASDPQGTGDMIFGGIQKGFNGIEYAWHWALGGGAWSQPLLAWWHSWRAGAVFKDEVAGFRWISHVISALMLATLFFPLLWTRERYTKLVSKSHVNLWTALKATLRCRPFVVILVTNIARNAGTLPRNLFFFIGTFYVCSGSKAEYSNAMGGMNAIVGLGFTILVWWMIKPLTRLIGKRVAFIGGAGMGLVQAIGTVFVATPGNIWGWFAFNVAFMPINSILGVSTAGIMPDICDIDELAYGERREGLFTAVMSFVNKMEISVMMPFTGLFLRWTGYDANLGASQPTWVLDRMRWMGFVPLIAISAVAFVFSCFMPITKEMMDKVRAELDKRHDLAGVTDPVET
jgi:GPH family glycoside/pentoside/hexuronide:cation symporter